MVLAVLDCETLRSGFFAQPANTWSSWAFVVAGALVWSRRRHRFDALVAAGLLLTGVGSAAFHGPWPAAGPVHDVPIVALLGALAARALPNAARASLPVVAAAALLVAAVDGATVPATAALALLAVAAELRARPPQRSDWRVLGVWLVAGMTWWAGQETSPWCHPDAWLQPHALWHVLAAAGFVLVTERRGPVPMPMPRTRTVSDG